MTDALYIHGYKGSPTENWQPALAERLQQENVDLRTTRLPNPSDPKLRSWAQKVLEEMGEAKYLFSHSLGSYCALNVLHQSSQSREQLRAAFLVSGGIRELVLPEKPRTVVDRFSIPDAREALSELRNSDLRIFAYHGRDDSIVPLEVAEHMSDACGATLRVIEGGKHLNARNTPEFEEFRNMRAGAIGELLDRMIEDVRSVM